VRNITFGPSEHAVALIAAGAVPVLVDLLNSFHDELMRLAVEALGNISSHSTHARDTVLHAGALLPLLQICSSQSHEGVYEVLLCSATRLLFNLCRSVNRDCARRNGLYGYCSLMLTSLFRCSACASVASPGQSLRWYSLRYLCWRACCMCVTRWR